MAETRLVLAPQPPDGTKLEMDFLDSTFFKTPGQQMPTPAQVFQGTVPVPELFGWRVDDKGYVYIYMQLIEGQTLLDGRDDLQSTGKEVMRNQLYEIIRSLRQLSQPSGKYIGSINCQKIPDYVFQSLTEAGPFPNIKEFNDWFSTLPQSRLPVSLKYKDPYRYLLPHDGDIKFTHADLHRGNIMVSSTAPFRVIAIVD
ncbi:hypothetical protein BDV32DRAFT_144595 [Aspergillus pseudonomiae]|nr:hypothetical protein BDV32DRAFT_144595 [Aspergillus pseudonomiae]